MADDFLRTIRRGAAIIRGYTPEPRSLLTRGSDLFSDFANKVSSMMSGLTSENAALIQEQMRQQQQMQMVSMVSNIERSKHEIAMTPIRNIRLN